VPLGARARQVLEQRVELRARLPPPVARDEPRVAGELAEAEERLEHLDRRALHSVGAIRFASDRR
jgi:hypothetical protein